VVANPYQPDSVRSMSDRAGMGVRPRSRSRPLLMDQSVMEWP